MKNITLYLFLLLLTFSVTSEAQSSKPALEISQVHIEDDSYAARNVSSKLKSRLKKDFTIMYEAVLKLSVDAEFGEMYTINGMDTYTTTEAGIKYTLTGDNLPTKKLELDVKCKGSNERDLKKKLGTSIIRNSKHIDALNAFIKEYVEENLGSCSQISAIIDAKLAKNEISKAYGMMGYYDYLDSCEDAKSKSEQAIEDKHAQYACDSAIQRGTILANSGDMDDLNKAIDLLQMIPPDAPCAENAITVSELVSENAKELSKYNSEKINDRITILNTLNHSDWKSWYRKNYTKIYKKYK